jgi:hypothetical protein
MHFKFGFRSGLWFVETESVRSSQARDIVSLSETWRPEPNACACSYVSTRGPAGGGRVEGVSARWQALWRQECVLFLEPVLRGASNVKVRVATVSRGVCFGFLFCCVRRDRCVGVKVLCMVCGPSSSSRRRSRFCHSCFAAMRTCAFGRGIFSYVELFLEWSLN